MQTRNKTKLKQEKKIAIPPWKVHNIIILSLSNLQMPFFVKNINLLGQYYHK